MFDTSGTNIVTNAQSAGRITVCVVEFKWDDSSFTDESGNLLQCGGDSTLSSPRLGRASSGAGMAGTANITLRNPAGRYSPLQAGSPIYSDIQNNKGMGIAVRIKIGFTDPTNGDETLTVFLGKTELPVIASPTSPTATFSCVGQEYLVFEHKGSSQGADVTGVKKDVFVGGNLGWLADLAAEGNVSSTDLDDSMFRIPWVWLGSGDSLWTEMQLCAGAEGGYLYFASDGELRFENAYHWLVDSDHRTSGESLDESCYKVASLKHEQKEVYNSVEVPYKPRGLGARTVLFTLSEEWVVEASTTKTFVAEMRAPIVAVEPLVVDADYVVVDNGGNNRGDDVSISLTVESQRVLVEVTNSSTIYQVTFMKFVLNGIQLVGYTSSQVTTDSADSPIGDPASALVKRLEYSANEYVQTIEQAEFLSTMLAARYKTPRATVTLSGVPGRPYLEPGDLVTATITAEGMAGTVFITGINWTYNSNGLYEMTLICIESAGFYGGDYTYSDFFIFNENTPGDASRVFF